MRSRRFTTISEQCHREWLAGILGMSNDENGGIDLFNETIGIELKSRFNRHSAHWTTAEEQRENFEEFYKDKELFWAFLYYGMNTNVSDILENEEDIEPYVTHRKVWLIEWDWIKQFPVYDPPTGPYRYASKKNFPDQTYFKKVNVKNGTIYLPKDTCLEDILK